MKKAEVGPSPKKKAKDKRIKLIRSNSKTLDKSSDSQKAETPNNNDNNNKSTQDTQQEPASPHRPTTLRRKSSKLKDSKTANDKKQDNGDEKKEEKKQKRDTQESKAASPKKKQKQEKTKQTTETQEKSEKDKTPNKQKPTLHRATSGSERNSDKQVSSTQNKLSNSGAILEQLLDVQLDQQLPNGHLKQPQGHVNGTGIRQEIKQETPELPDYLQDFEPKLENKILLFGQVIEIDDV